ncbi:hypothetical protein CPHO_04270 [Corynebacterium phocae]|uniref:Alanine racemase N-terminal domain-containing protein n=1 Tax=Corynebacterium phocae TaxID=161895 RepID=A0A1L7D2A6_9CORY|nr:YggS family pyridoxal phosphate-dependent enzyme [Corynebacterium phocae]APT92234.1 hypothetical protein CPHO_04270 [Corynebacterium phocae]KAA8725375.1 YggS family pyridoxal phosphate-dependent enzyme [Corynebacterium phocae]
MDRKAQLHANLEAVRAEIARLAAAAGRPAPRLLPVTKFHPAEDIALLGVTDVAENREQEARAKAEALPDVRFHMIGQVQTKKANHVARWAASVHSVDSVKLAHALDRGAGLAMERGQREGALVVYIQVSADGDTARGGVPYADLDEVVAAVEDSAHLQLHGLMVVPPLGSDPAAVFAAARGRADALGERLGRSMELSAGMSQDKAEAIANGTDIVRVGTDIMGPRPLA